VLSKSTIKRITKLGQKKYRNTEGLFVAEGVKVINELLNSSIELKELYCTEEAHFVNHTGTEVTLKELKSISFLTTPQKALAVFKIPEEKSSNDNGLTVALDNLRDPGNLGTIIRLCDWFGVEELICSEGTVDCYNPKVIQATMGSVARVNIRYVDLPRYIRETQRDVYGTFMEGSNVYELNLPQEAVLVMGNEANGITQEISELLKNRLTIPRFGTVKATESLNVAMATSIFLSEFKR